LPVIRTENLTKRYGPVTAITDINLAVSDASIYGFLGANGSGKTTTIRSLLGLIRPTGGQAYLFEHPVGQNGKELRRRIGYLPGELRFYEDMSGEETLRFLGRFYGRDFARRRRQIAERLELSRSALWLPVRKYSRGMKQKLGIIQALQHDPELLILDEPTEGLDPLMQRAFYDLIREAKHEGKTIFMSSHNLSEVEKVCERVGIVRQGRLVADESIETLREKRLHIVEATLDQPAPAELFRLPDVEVRQLDQRRVELKVRGVLDPLLRRLAGLTIRDLVVQRASLEDVFMEFYRKGDNKVK